MNLNAWRDPFARVLRELWLALFTHDTALIRRCVRRTLGRLQLVRDWNSPHPILRAAVRETACAIGVSAFWLVLVVLMVSGGAA